ncbi:MAG TPA: DUF885 domain-containing protein [Thermoanaerobaculia bacterium]|nr:DUF885 domain-containing protein [Thermoanaerobaculia bacterium]
MGTGIPLRAKTWIAAATIAAPVLYICAADKPSTGSEAVRKAADEYWKFLESESIPIRVRGGLPVDRLPDLSLEHTRANAEFGKSLLASLSAVDEKAIDHEDALSLQILRSEAKILTEGPDYYWLSFPATPYVFQFLGVGQAFSSHPFKSKADGDHYLALLVKYTDLVASIKARLMAQAGRGILMAKEEVPLVAGAFASAARNKEANLFWVKDERLASWPSEDRQDFQRRLSEAITTRVAPTVKDLNDYLGGEYAKKAPDSVGLAQYPGGKEFYRVMVRRSTTLDVSPEDIHKIGLAGIARLNEELDGIRKKLGFAGTMDDFRKHLKTDARFFAKTPEQIGDRLMAMQNKILPEVPKWFGKTPKAPFGVQRLEPALEAAVTFGYYQTPTAQDPKGYYKYNGSKLEERSMLIAGALISHELVPGHHFQINLARENEGLPRFRRESFYTAYGEGWGDYASDLAGQMGMYEEPYDRAGRIAMDLFLTSRLVVDTGMNFYGWPRAKAIAYMKENTLQSDAEIETETLRYCCDLPSQALAYKMGMRKLVELRENARKTLGPSFDVRKYHDTVLGSGSLPLDVLAKHVDWYIARSK